MRVLPLGDGKSGRKTEILVKNFKRGGGVLSTNKIVLTLILKLSRSWYLATFCTEKMFNKTSFKQNLLLNVALCIQIGEYFININLQVKEL